MLGTRKPAEGGALVVLLSGPAVARSAAGPALDAVQALFLEAIRGGAVDTPYAHVKGAAIAAEAWTPVSFAVDGVVKDVGLMIEEARGTSFSDDLLTALLGLYERAAARGHAGDDRAAVRTAFDA